MQKSLTIWEGLEIKVSGIHLLSVMVPCKQKSYAEYQMPWKTKTKQIKTRFSLYGTRPTMKEGFLFVCFVFVCLFFVVYFILFCLVLFCQGLSVHARHALKYWAVFLLYPSNAGSINTSHLVSSSKITSSKTHWSP